MVKIQEGENEIAYLCAVGWVSGRHICEFFVGVLTGFISHVVCMVQDLKIVFFCLSKSKVAF